MLAQHEWQDANRKRGREDDYADIAVGGTLGFTEHRSKRMQVLPLRMTEASRRWPPAPSTLPTAQQPHSFGQLAPHTVTPSDSDSEDAHASRYGRNRHTQQEQPMQAHSPPQFYMEPELSYGEDMDMMMDVHEPAAPSFVQGHAEEYRGDNHHLQPGSLQPDPIGPPVIAGRMPTPIQPSFAAQVRGGSKNWGGAAGNIMSTPPPQNIYQPPPTDHSSLPAPQQDPSNCQSSAHGGAFAPRSLDSGLANWSHPQNRRLPSPISEAGGEGESSQGSSNMLMDSATVYHDQHNLMTHTPPRASSAMEMGGSAPAISLPPRVATPHVVVTTGGGGGDGMEVETGTTPSPPRKGHSRSRHTVASWTNQQPGMKKSFSIGYRSDCEKCRLKVPGHFNHIIIS
ncbi:hypothetical protein GE09DRAFT_227109 [Coniochaeta sp. 2T2.1]|nr:hypothetical protein GE09DRAFT_227109 [Coniochaeta sp. 2T2.1]